MKQSKTAISVLFFVLLILVATYFLLVPLLYSEIPNILSPRKFPNLEYATNYYVLLNNFFGVVVGVGGLSLGAYYFLSRKLLDEKIKNNDILNQRQEKLFNELEEYNSCVHKILSLAVNNEQELRHTRSIMSAKFENIELMLNKLDYLGLSEEAADAILKVNSFVDKCDLISQSRFSKLNLNSLYPQKDRFIELMKNAKKISCFYSKEL